MRTKILDLAQEIDKEFQKQEEHIHSVESAIDELNYVLSKEKIKRLEAAKRLREFASWLETED